MVTAAVAGALVLLLVADASLVGYRAVCGYSAFVDRSELEHHAARVGAAAGAAAAVLLACWFGALLLAAGDPGALLDDLTRSGAALLTVYAAFAALTGVALAGWYVAPSRWATLAMVTILGPLTLVRPLVLVAGAAAAVASAEDAVAPVVASVAVVLVAVVVETIALQRWGAASATAFRPAQGTARPAPSLGRRA